jgi:hypothetical protein
LILKLLCRFGQFPYRLFTGLSYINMPWTESVIGEITYKGKIYAKIKNSEYSSFRYERSDTSRLYEFDINSHNETVIYDLNWNVGDTVRGDYVVLEKGISSNYGIERAYIKIAHYNTYKGSPCCEKSLTYQQTFGFTHELYNKGPLYNFRTEDYFLEEAIINGLIYTDVENRLTDNIRIPDPFQLFQSYPNPFNTETVIHYQLPKVSHVTLRIINVLGQEVRRLVDAEQATGYYTVRWDGKNDVGLAMATGIYLVHMEACLKVGQAGGFVETRKALLLR